MKSPACTRMSPCGNCGIRSWRPWVSEIKTRRIPPNTSETSLHSSDIPVFFDCFDPEFQRQIFALRIAQVWAKLLIVTVAEQIQIEGNNAGQIPHIASVTLDIAFKFGKRQIVGIESH